MRLSLIPISLFILSLTDCSTNLRAPAIFPNGVNLQPSYYNDGNVNFEWGLMQQYPNIKTLRLEIEPDKLEQAKSWITQAYSHGYNIVATYHKYSVLGSNDINDLLDAANWWKSNYHALSLSGSFLINLMNEWGDHTLSPQDYANAYNQAIKIVRQVYQGRIIIDIPGWGQETTTALNAVKGIGGVKITDTDIALSAHIYPIGWNQAKSHALQRSDLDDLVSSGRPCVVGEFGGLPKTSPVDVRDMVIYAKSLGCAVIGWAWNGDGTGMNMVTPDWMTNPNPSQVSINSYFWDIYNLL